jgi:type I restriction enzyme M protein
MAPKKYNQQELNKVLWAAADSSRTSVDAGVYKDYALAMLFYKYLSDLSNKKRQEYKERFGNDQERIEEKLRLDRFYLPENTSFDYIYSIIEHDNIGEELNKVLDKIEEANRSKLEGIFNIDFNSESVLGKLESRNKMIRNLISDFHKIDLSEVDDDVMGNAYMYMIEKFGADAGKKAGEFFTPSKVSKLVAKLAQPKPGDRIVDNACGSGGLLLLAGAEVEAQGSKNYVLYGQESKGSTYQPVSYTHLTLPTN